jgi:hypothetical protein
LSEARIWRHRCPELVEFVNSGVLFEQEYYPVKEILQHTEIEGMTNIRYDNSHLGDEFHIA